MEVARVVLGILERFEPIDDERLLEKSSVTETLLKKQTVATESFSLAHDGHVRNAELLSNLPEGGAGEDSKKEAIEYTRMPEPVRGGESLITEGDAT
jgi:hypothetical protein